MTRSRIKPRRSKPRRGSEKDPAYREYILSLPCLIAGKHICQGRVTGHHIRRFGSGRVDRRMIPLCAGAHLIQCGSDAIEHGKRLWCERFGIDLEAEIVSLNERYEQALHLVKDLA